MNHTREQIISKAKKIMKDHLDEYYTEGCVDEELNDPYMELVNYGKYKGEEISLWLVAINSLFDNHNFLFISDETGEPVYYQNFNTFVFDVEKGKDGKYYMVEID